MNISQKITAACIAGALTIGGGVAAFAAEGNGSGTSTDPGAKTELIAKLCEHKDEIVPRLTEAKTKINERIVTLTDRKATATEANHPRVVTRIDRRLTRLNKRLTRVEKRLDQAPAWIAEHCS